MVRILCHSKAPKQPQPRYWTHAHNRAAIAALYRATKPHAKARRSQPTPGADKAPRGFLIKLFQFETQSKTERPRYRPPQFPARPRDPERARLSNIAILVHS